ncbi:SPOR domain-containing protein [Marinomonas pollencensis]|uniref:DamX protein n=1 Tax=Marinomonas pollencensis TaxID=491954 RepID=A0A3E0DI25_9GAMM|nr:AAA family ATPase [Marinomonas pollencensis]REG82365.1 DamX protein [Marinomonas pollencensis]
MSEPNFQFDLESALNQPPKATLRDPFGSKDMSAYFASEEGNQQLALLEHLSRYSNLLSVVQGPQGSGKSRFMMEFVRHQDDSTIISQVKASMLMTAGQLLQAIYAGFASQLREPPNEATFGPLLKFSHDLEAQGQKALILIDNAQELNTDAVSMLLDMMSLATENQAVPHVALFTEFPLSRNLDAYQRSRYEQLSHTLTIAPYSLEQTKAYLLHRVRTVGGSINLPFNDKQIKQIHQESAGYPGAINKIAQAMMGNAGKGAQRGRRFNLALGFPLVHMALLCLVMLGILIAVLFSDPDDTELQVADRTSNVIPLSPKIEPRAGQSSSATIARIDAMQRKIGTEGALGLPPIPTEAAEPDSEPTVAPAQSSISTAPIRQDSPVTTTPTLTQERPKVVLQPMPVEKTATIPEKQQATDAFDKTQWWLAQSPGRYTLQLLGTYNLDTVKDFIKSQGSISVFSYFKSKYNGRDWYVVVYGMYRNRSEAIASVESLPKDLQNLNPWARSVRSIQQDIKKFE